MSDVQSVSPQTLADELGGFLRENILADEVEVGPATPLDSLGVDSFSLMEVILFVERQYGFLMPVEELTPETMKTLDALSRRLHELIQDAN